MDLLWFYSSIGSLLGTPPRPPFHAYYQDEVLVVGVDPIEIIAGHLPRRQRRLVEAWAELHQEELMADWERLQSGEVPLPIPPLE